MLSPRPPGVCLANLRDPLAARTLVCTHGRTCYLRKPDGEAFLSSQTSDPPYFYFWKWDFCLKSGRASVTRRQSLVVAAGRHYPKATHSVQPPPCWLLAGGKPRHPCATIYTGRVRKASTFRVGEYSVLVSMKLAQTASSQVPGAYIPVQHRRKSSACRGQDLQSPSAPQLPGPMAGKSHRAVGADPGELGRLGAAG